MRIKAAGSLTLVLLLLATAASGEPNASMPNATETGIDIQQKQRAHVWQFLSSPDEASGRGQMLPFSDWFNEADVFASRDPHPGERRVPFPGQPIGAFAAAEIRMSHNGDAPLITFVHYNRAAYRHIRQHRLYREGRLQELVRAGASDATFPAMRIIPPLPATASVVMTGWWPIDARGPTPMPVWDGESTDLKAGGNGYTTWKRVVVVRPTASGEAVPSTRVVFAGRSFPVDRKIPLDDLVHLRVDGPTASRLMTDTGARKAAVLALGRPLRAGDFLALVGMHMFAAESSTGTWATFWWHDRPTEGPYAQDRPSAVHGVWRNYLMDTAFDAVLPREPDGAAKICFNPWFEARFPEGKSGTGVTSNCVNCHSRASYPTIAFLPIQRGTPQPAEDPAYAEGRLRTGQLWSVASPGMPVKKATRSLQTN